jgi:hypothetical protein
MPLTALDNVSVMETMTSGRLVTEPSPAARSYFAEKRAALFSNPTAHPAFLENAWIPWRNAFQSAREWEGYTDLLAVRRTEFGATSIMLDAYDVPGSVQNNPNDPQNELRLRRYRPNYRQATLWQNRDEFTPITVDNLEIARIFQNSGPESTAVSDFVTNQLTMAGNRDKAAEFHTLMSAIGITAAKAEIFHLQLPSLGLGATEDDARLFATTIRTQVLALQDFVPFYSIAKNTQTVPKDQVRLVIRQSTMQRLGALAYATSFNPEFVFALPQGQIIELPDHYFDRNPGLTDKQVILVDSGNDSAYGSLAVVDTFYGWGVDPYPIKSSENRALHHASVLDVNPFKTFVTGGTGAGQSIVVSTIVPVAVAGTVYGPDDIVAGGGNLVRGQLYSTTASVTDADGFAAGGWVVSLTGAQSPTGATAVGLYGNVQIGLDDPTTSVTVTWTSIIDPTKTASQTFNVVGVQASYDGSGVYIQGETFAFAPGTGTGGVLTYTKGNGGVYEGSLDGGTTYTPLGASPLAVAEGAHLTARSTAASGYKHEDGSAIKVYGPYTPA